MKLEHIGIAVENLEESERLFTTLLNSPVYKTEKVDSEQVNTAFIQTDNTKIELLASTSTDGPIAKFIAKKGPGIHHIAFEVNNIEEEIRRLSNAGFEFVAEQIKQGADNKRIVFLHPKSTGKVLIELCEEIKE